MPKRPHHLKEHGALKMVECWGDDVPDGKLLLPDGRPEEGRRDGYFSWMCAVETGPHEGMKSDGRPSIQPDVNPMPFDGKRRIFGCFEVLLEREPESAALVPFGAQTD